MVGLLASTFSPLAFAHPGHIGPHASAFASGFVRRIHRYGSPKRNARCGSISGNHGVVKPFLVYFALSLS